MTHRPNLLVRAVIVANTAVLLVSLRCHTELLETAHLVFDLFFVAEIVVRFAGAGCSPRRFFALTDPTGRWNMFDTTVIGLSLLPILGVNLTVLRVARLARLTHGARHIGHLRLTDLLRINKTSSSTEL